MHQRSRRVASTFWAGCGAVCGDAFLAAGGFDPAYRRPSVEDVELGYRLRAAGHRIRLVPEAQATHLKRWTLGGWLASDLRDRAIPWARLVRAGRGLPADLNFTARDRAASAFVGLALFLVAASVWRVWLLGAAISCLALAAFLDRSFLAFAAHRGSTTFQSRPRGCSSSTAPPVSPGSPTATSLRIGGRTWQNQTSAGSQGAGPAWR